MKRERLLRIAVSALGGLAVVTAIAALGVTLSMRSGAVLSGSAAPLWGLPLLAGATVGVLSWFLLAAQPIEGTTPDDRRDTVDCANCGNSMLADWRICPHCGSSSQVREPVAETRSTADIG
jgi:hypothetical protein